MKVFVTGAAGQLGHDVMAELRLRGHEALGGDIAPEGSLLPLDITDEAAVRRALRSAAPDAVIHCAAWTDVDAAERPENADRVWAVNAAGTAHVARACKATGAKLVHISTDYVFSGEGDTPWRPDDAPSAPRNVYARTKLAAEEAVRATLARYFIVRISWAFGPTGRNFVRTMLKLGATHPLMQVVNDQLGAPTYTPDLARLLVDMAESERYGIYHAANGGGFISWYDFACEIFRQAGEGPAVIPVSTEAYGLSRADRPRNSRLDTGKLAEAGFRPLPDWRDALGRFLREWGGSGMPKGPRI